MAGLSLNNSQCSSPTLYTHTVYFELHGRRQAGSEGQGSSAGEQKVGGTEGGKEGGEGGGGSKVMVGEGTRGGRERRREGAR